MVVCFVDITSYSLSLVLFTHSVLLLKGRDGDDKYLHYRLMLKCTAKTAAVQLLLIPNTVVSLLNCLVGDSVVCGAAHLKEPLRGGDWHGTGRLQQSHSPGTRPRTLRKHC